VRHAGGGTETVYDERGGAQQRCDTATITKKKKRKTKDKILNQTQRQMHAGIGHRGGHMVCVGWNGDGTNESTGRRAGKQCDATSLAE